MATTPTPKVAAYDNANATIYTTTAWTPTANTMTLMLWALNDSATITAAPTIAGHADFGTWTSEPGLSFAISGGFCLMGWHWSLSDAAPASSTATITANAAMTGCWYAVIEVTELDTAAPSVQSVTATGTATSGAITLAAFASANNIALSFWVHNANEVTTPDAAYAELTDNPGSAPVMAHEVQWLVNDTGPSASWATSSAYGGIAVELKATAAAVELPPGGPLVVGAAVRRASRW